MFVERYAPVAVGEALVVRTVFFVADVVDGKVDVHIVFAQRLPVGINVVYAVAAFNGFDRPFFINILFSIIFKKDAICF